MCPWVTGLAAELRPLHLLTDDEVCGRAGFLEAAERLVEAAGARMAFHLRAPHGSGRWLHDAAARLVGAGGVLIVNDRVDVALAAGASGVQLGRRSLSLEEVRRMVPAGLGIGVSVHGAETPLPAADWLIAGNVYSTASHPGKPGAGVELVRRLAGGGVPVVAIGGVTPERVAELRDAGAAGVAVIRGVWDASDPAAAIERYLNAWDR